MRRGSGTGVAGADGVVRFAPTSGRLLGLLGLVLCLLGLVTATFDDDFGWRLGVGSVFVATLIWGSMLKPRVLVDHGLLVLRNMFETVTLPLAGVQSVVVQQVLAVSVGGKKYYSAAAGRSRFQSTRKPRHTRELAMTAVPGEGYSLDAGVTYADFIESRLDELAADARRERGVEKRSPEQAALRAEVVREPAWLEIALCGISGLAFVATFFWA